MAAETRPGIISALGIRVLRFQTSPAHPSGPARDVLATLGRRHLEQLSRPGYAFAMYLCKLRRIGKELPQIIPEHVADEVSSVVASITHSTYTTAGLAHRWWPLGWAIIKDEEFQ